MKKTVTFLFVLLMIASCAKDEPAPTTTDDGAMGDSPILGNVVPCENGMAGDYPCNGFDLLGTLDLNELQATAGNDIWGWTDPETGQEYALMGLDNGTAFIAIPESGNPIYLGKLPTATTASPWRDVKVYENVAYIVAEANGHGVQVFDLTKLRDVTGAPQTFTEDGRYTGLGSAHNIVVNAASGFAYPVGTARDDAFNGGVHFLDLQNPLVPVAAGGWGANGYTHDAQVISYSGPDQDHAGAELFIGANEDQVVVVDITNKANPVALSTLPYPNIGYTHQGWFTEDQRYFILGDELDEVNDGFNTRTLVFDMTDLDNPVLHHTYLGPTKAIDHNGYVLGDRFYLANYAAGVRLLDISGIGNGIVEEIGHFDTFPNNDNTQFDGAWSVYPFFESGHIVVSDINSGFFVIKKSNGS